jgi:uncharacterized repeat protein (TIGR01451 family)
MKKLFNKNKNNKNKLALFFLLLTLLIPSLFLTLISGSNFSLPDFFSAKASEEIFINKNFETPFRNRLEEELFFGVEKIIQEKNLDIKILSVRFDEQNLTLNFDKNSENYLKSEESYIFADQVSLKIHSILEGEKLNKSVNYSFLIEGKPPYQRSDFSLLNNYDLFGASDFKVVLSPGHGYYDHETYGWTLQRPWLNGIVEDFVNSDLIIELDSKLDGSIIPYKYPTRELDKSFGNHTASGYPMWQMSAKDYLETQGLPASVWNTGSTNIASDIRARPLYGNYLGADMLINLHNNAGGGCGTETLYDNSNGYQTESQALASIVQNKLITKIRSDWDSGWCDRGVKGFNGNYGENRIFNGAAVIVELGFMDNTSDNLALQDPVFRGIATDALKEAIIEYYQSLYPNPPSVLVDQKVKKGDILSTEIYEDNASVGFGETVTYKINFENVSSSIQNNVQLKIPLNPGMDYLDGSCTDFGGSPCSESLIEGENFLVWNLGNLNPSQAGEVYFSLKINNFNPNPQTLAYSDTSTVPSYTQANITINNNLKPKGDLFFLSSDKNENYDDITEYNTDYSTTQKFKDGEVYLVMDNLTNEIGETLTSGTCTFELFRYSRTSDPTNTLKSMTANIINGRCEAVLPSSEQTVNYYNVVGTAESSESMKNYTESRTLLLYVGGI